MMKITCKNALAICVFGSKGREINPQICESNGNVRNNETSYIFLCRIYAIWFFILCSLFVISFILCLLRNPTFFSFFSSCYLGLFLPFLIFPLPVLFSNIIQDFLWKSKELNEENFKIELPVWFANTFYVLPR